MERAAIGVSLNYFDHFVRMSLQRTPYPEARVAYSVNEDRVEFQYNLFGTLHSIHLEKLEVLNDFWGSLAKVEQYFNSWREG